MNKKKERRGGLIRKKPLTESEEKNRVISIAQETGAITLIGIFNSLETATHVANSYKQKENTIYIHGDANRILAKV